MSRTAGLLVLLALLGLARAAAAQSTVAGSRSKEAIDRVMRDAAPRFKACYQQVLKHNPRLAGKVVLSFAINASGEVSHAGVASSTLDSPTVEGCLVHVVLRLQFPAGGATTVNYPFLFQPSR